MESKRKCLECNEPFSGRIDKKFCSDQCRNSYNYRNVGYSNALVRRINSILRKNRNVLEELNPNGKTKVHLNKLKTRGFDFTYFTHQYITKTGNTYYFCYEYGYLKLQDDFYALVKRED